MFLTGRKRDTWLVKTFGALIAGLGLSLWRNSLGERREAAVATAATVALTLAACEAWFVTRGAIRPIYLADAVLEVGFAAALLKD
jgi:hypothetical protein